jgi:hypothetical protein
LRKLQKWAAFRQIADRCQAAEGNEADFPKRLLVAAHDLIWPTDGTGPKGFFRLLDAGGYVDAARLLVPVGWSFSLGEMMGLPLEYRWRCHLRDHREPYNPATGAWVDRDCRTPALAVCAAAMAARAKESER